MPLARQVPHAVEALRCFLVGRDSAGDFYIAEVDSNGELTVDVADRALRDLGKVDLAQAIPGAAEGNNTQVSSGDGSAVAAVAARSGRVAVVLTAITDNVDIYYGYTAGVTTGNGIPVALTKFMGTRIPTQAALWVVGTAAFTVAVSEEWD